MFPVPACSLGVTLFKTDAVMTFLTRLKHLLLKYSINNNNNNNNNNPAYQNTTSEAFWDILIYAEHNEVRANRIDARLVSHERKEVCTIEMSCPWIESRAKKDEEKTLKYGPMMWELKQRYNGYRVEQYNVIIDVLGGFSKHLERSVRRLLGARARSVLERMQKSVISKTLNIARTFKINT